MQHDDEGHELPGESTLGPAPSESAQSGSAQGGSTQGGSTPRESAPGGNRLGRGGLVAIIAAATVSVLAFAAVGVGVSVGAALHRPQVQVERYLDAVRAGHIEDALAMTRTQVDASDVLLTDDAYAAASERVTAYRITKTTLAGKLAKVTASISLGTESFTQDFTLERGAAKSGLFFDTWSLKAPELSTLVIDEAMPGGAEIRIPGVSAEAVHDAASGLEGLRAFPGVYEVSIEDNEWFEVQPVDGVVAGFGGVVTATLTATLTAAGHTEVERAVNAYIDGCAASTELVPAGCGFGLRTEGYTASDIRWSLDSRPVVAIEDHNGVLAVTGVTPGYLSMTCTGTKPDGTVGLCTNVEPVEFSVNGYILRFGDAGAEFLPNLLQSLLPEEPGAPA